VSIQQWQLDGIAADLTSTMPDLCDVFRRSGVADDYGGGAGQAEVLSDVPVGITPVQSNAFGDETPGGRVGLETYFQIALPLGTLVSEGDEIVVTTKDNLRLTLESVQRPESYDVMVKAQGVTT
jgi:hypothetical protein